ncbi:MAG: HD domain-containing protein, partial [Oscillospiraceae bacterium]|nr:HD domain-containing protein [Oscillospiraceae bacterium]
MRSYASLGDFGPVERAYEVALRAHEGQKRVSGEPYIDHPLEVAIILSEFEMDVVSIAAAILHDVVEDTDVTDKQLRAWFGGEVAVIVDGVTKLEKIEFISKEEQQAENMRKMFVAMSKDIRVIVIK